MHVVAYKTPKITARSHKLQDVLVAAIPDLPEKSVVAVASKIVSLCEGRVVPMKGVDKDRLIAQEATKYLPRVGKYKVSFAVTHGMLAASAGIDESNGDGNYVLWPVDLQASANDIRRFLAEHFKVRHVGVVLTDSTLRPLRWGVSGIALASSGFEPVVSAIGKPDLFGRPFQFTTTSIQDGLAAAAALVMGEGDQQTPVAVLQDLPFVNFVDRDPSAPELAALHIDLADDMYGPFLEAVAWQKGQLGQGL